MATVTTDNDWQRVDKDGSPSYRVYTKPIVKSQQDDREYRIIQLDNGLQATLVHDVKADKAAASLDVAVGHLFDPADMPGLAHFCEHLLFMGTETFPKENAYSEFLAQNNGSSNAYTSTSNTNYYFNVATSALPGALERFAAFFHCPLFTPSCTSRELNAVDSEHKKNHQADMWRIFQLNKHLSRPGHVWSKFGSGNRESLSKAARELRDQGKLQNGSSTPEKFGVNLSVPSTPITSRSASPAPSVSSSTNSELDADGGAIGRETRRRLVEWWSQEYCASRMRLAIVGKESLDELSDLAAALFSPILNRGRDALPSFPEHPFGKDEKGTVVSVQTVMAFHALEISFPLEYQPPLWKHKPINLISHFVGHEGPGSLHSYLKNKHWITSLSTGPQNLARGFAMFKVTIYLTPEGFKDYRSVVQAAFKYFALLRESKFDSYHFEEVVKLANIRFSFLEKRPPDDYATWLSEHMAWPVPHNLLLAAPRLTWDYENEEDRKQGEAKFVEYLNLLQIDQARAVLMGRKDDHVKVHPNLNWEKEPWYGTEYAVQRWDDDFVKDANGANDIKDLFLPGPNEFIPSKLDVDKKEGIEHEKRPKLIRQTPLSTLWYKKDDRFWVPKAHVVIDFRSHIISASARNSVLTRIYAELVTDSLTEFAYNADLAGLSYSFVNHATGIWAAMNGYNDKVSVLAHHLLDRIKTLQINPQRLEVIKETIRREYENFFLGQSYTLSDYNTRNLLADCQWTVEEKLAELASVTADEVQQHYRNILAEVNLRVLVAGNIYKDEAIKIAEMAEQGLGKSPVQPQDLVDKALLLPQGSNYILAAPLPNRNEANSALSYFVYYGPIADQKIRVISALLTQILSEPAFNVLRTREQLGYIVSCSAWTLAGASEKGLRIVVQSEKKPGYLEDRVEAFLEEMKVKLDEMTDEEFSSHRSGLEKKWLEAEKNLAEEVARYINQLNSGHWDFLRSEKDAALLRSITKVDVIQLFLSHVHQGSPTRAKLSVHMRSQKPREKRISAAAAQAFELKVHEAFPDLDEKAWRNAAEGENPALKAFGQYWLKTLGDSDEGKKVLAQLPILLAEYPVPGEEAGEKRPNVTYIEDRKAFKASLTPSIHPGPLVEWNDLPQPKF